MNTLPLFADDSNTPKLKRCYSCPEGKQWHPATPDYFHRNKSKKDGFHDECKLCCNARRKAYTESHREQEYLSRKKFRENNADRISEERRAYREANKVKLAERHRQWEQSEAGAEYRKRYYHENKERINQHSRNQYIKHREVRTLKQRQYLQTEKGRMVDKAHRQKRKAQKRASEGSYTAAQLQDQLARQKHKCYWCHVKLEKTWHADHILPLARGGSNSIDNIVCSCPTCNMRRKDKLPHEWLDGGRLL